MLGGRRSAPLSALNVGQTLFVLMEKNVLEREAGHRGQTNQPKVQRDEKTYSINHGPV